MDEDGKELLPVYVVARDQGQREVATRHFVREQKVIVRITVQTDAHIKLLTYRIKLDGAIKVEAPTVTAGAGAPAEQPGTTPAQPAAQTTEPLANVPTPAAGATPATTETTADPKLKDKMKLKIKDQAKKALMKIIDN